jgi:hypothetical protein
MPEMQQHRLALTQWGCDAGPKRKCSKAEVELALLRARDEITESKEKNPAAGRNAGKESGVYA